MSRDVNNRYERDQEANRRIAKRSRVKNGITPASSSQWAEVLASADRYY
jgi:hypothetical protein